MSSKKDQRERRVAPERHRLEDRLADERERALRADQQAREDLERLVGVEERAQPVAGRVLDLELARDALGQLAVGAQLVADLAPGPAASSGAAAAKRSAAPAAAVSITVPSASTNVSERTVR